MSIINLITFKPLGDERGSLIALEENKAIPFNIKRVYYMFDLDKDIPRGFHAHKELQQVAICVQGNCKFVMDDGSCKEEIVITNNATGILIDKMVWHEMHEFSKDCILMVVASDIYDENDYIRNYEDFIELAGGK